MFYVLEGNTCIKSIEDDPVLPGRAEKRAREFFAECKERQSKGYPKTTILDEIKL
jgi:hypothetical protein